MIKSLFKARRIVISSATQQWSLHTPVVKYSIFNLFKKKTDSNLPQTKDKEAEEIELEEKEAREAAEKAIKDDAFVDKKQYYEKLKKEREEYESEREKEKKQFEFEEQRDRREFEVNIAQVDYARVVQDNINIRITDEFKHLEELYYFISNMRVRLSEENIRKCIEGFLSLAERINSKDLEKPQYQEFIEVLKANVMLLSDNTTLLLLLKFADLYIVDDELLWQNLERKIFQKFQQFNKDELVSCIIHFANQNEGSDPFYDQFEKVITPSLPELDLNKLVALAQSYYQVRRGTKEFFIILHKEILSKLEGAEKSDLVRLCMVYSAMNIEDKFGAFQKIEAQIKERVDEFNLLETCLVAESFGFDYGSEDLFRKLEKRILAEFSDLEYEQFKFVLRGFIYSYRGSKQLFKAMKNKLQMFFPKMDLTTLALIAKAYHITENDDKQFEGILERYVINGLKRLDQVNVDELFEVASSYNVTRVGSREIYKILEFVIREKFEAIAKKPEVARGLYFLYTTSGLCSPELLRKLQMVV